MRRPAVIALLALVLPVLAVLALPASPGAARSVAAHTDAQAAPTPGTESDWYTYDGRYSFTVDYRRHLEYGGPNYGTETLHANVDGLLLGVGLSRRGIRPNADGTVLVDGTSYFEEVTDDGDFAIICDSEKVTDPTGLVPRLSSRASGTVTATLFGYFGLRSAQMCSATDEPEYPAEFDLPSFTTSFVIPPDSVGSPTLIAPLKRKVSWADCPGSGDSGTTECSYTIEGTLTLTLKSGPAPFVKPVKAKVDKHGKASVKAHCRVGCTAKLSVTPRTGSKVLATTKSSIPAGGTRTLSAKLTKAEQRTIKRAGGARLVVQYTAKGQQSRSFVTTVRV